VKATERFSPVSPAARDDEVAKFAASLPDVYRLRHGEAEIRAHARVAARRGSRAVNLELVPGPSAHEQWLCVVADDRPGLLSLLSAAIAAHSLDILSARVYCRERARGLVEAVDLFSLRRIKPPFEIEPAGPLLGALQRSIEELLRGELSVGALLRRGMPTPRPASAPSSVVYFHDTGETDLLLVQATDRPGLLLTITMIVFREGLTIAASHVTTFAETARDEFEIREIDGSRPSEARKHSLVAKLREALVGSADP
jgi:UTP:GlnB (protein PII) uridylyltransferase